ncbi:MULTISPECIES: hypothetical protein [unclassified Pedobacter]|nr:MULTISPECIES: hypothetical protein [unclassified Pedobacter]
MRKNTGLIHGDINTLLRYAYGNGFRANKYRLEDKDYCVHRLSI